MNKGVACGIGAPCHINNEYQVFNFNYVYIYIFIFIFFFPFL